MRDQRFAQLDGLRGLAALAVVVEHLSNAGMPIVSGIPLGGQSRIAVWLFFVLSAFLLTTQALAAPPGERIEWTLRYLLRRIFRIYPLFIFCIAADVISRRMAFSVGMGYLNLTQPCCAEVYWSIPPEFKFYFLIPLIGMAAVYSPRAIISALLLAALASIMLDRGYDFFAFLSTFCFGSIAAILLVKWPEFAKRISMAWPVAPIVALACSVPLIEASGWQIIPWYWNGMHGALWATVVLACAFGERHLSWLASRPLRYAGAISFSIYMTHPWVVSVATRAGLSGRFWAGGIVLFFVIVFGVFISRMIEYPGRRLGKSIESRIFPRIDHDMPADAIPVSVSAE
jgi:peptidoglycan/LPS O-acetylase OafA/YrhL